MPTLYSVLPEPIPLNDKEKQLAEQSSKVLAHLLQGSAEVHLHLQTEGESATNIVLPHVAAKLLLEALKEMAQGKAVSLLPTDAELTTQQAADLVRVSRPFFIKLLEEGKMPYRRVGAHRRVLYRDVLCYIEEEEARRVRVMEELVAETERLGLYESDTPT